MLIASLASPALMHSKALIKRAFQLRFCHGYYCNERALIVIIHVIKNCIIRFAPATILLAIHYTHYSAPFNCTALSFSVIYNFILMILVLYHIFLGINFMKFYANATLLKF